MLQVVSPQCQVLLFFFIYFLSIWGKVCVWGEGVKEKTNVWSQCTISKV